MKRLLLPLSFGILGTAILVWLGVWQLQRLEWKQDILNEITDRIAADPVAIPDIIDRERDRFLPVRESGIISGDELHVLVSQKQIGAGYRIIAKFETNAGRTILVDRGFIPVEDKAKVRTIGATTVTGNLHWPDEKGSSIPDPDVAKNIWFARDVTAMSKQLGTEEILLIARDPLFETDEVAPLPVDTRGIPNDHLQYAITWLLLAGIWLSMTLYFIWRTRAPSKG